MLVVKRLPGACYHKGMASTKRADRFSEILGEELKAEYSSRGFTVRAVAAELGIHHPTLINYTTGKRMIPVGIIIDVCDVIQSDPVELVDRAYSRLVAELGPPPA